MARAWKSTTAHHSAPLELGNGESEKRVISDPPTQAELQVLRDKCEELADDVRPIAALVHALRGALVAVGVAKAGA